MRKIQEEFREKEKKLYMCFMDLKKVFDRVPRRIMQWVLRKKGLPEILMKAVMSWYEDSKRKVEVTSEFKRILCSSWCTSGICFVTFVVCNGGGCCDR